MSDSNSNISSPPPSSPSSTVTSRHWVERWERDIVKRRRRKAAVVHGIESKQRKERMTLIGKLSSSEGAPCVVPPAAGRRCWYFVRQNHQRISSGLGWKERGLPSTERNLMWHLREKSFSFLLLSFLVSVRIRRKNPKWRHPRTCLYPVVPKKPHARRHPHARELKRRGDTHKIYNSLKKKKKKLK